MAVKDWIDITDRTLAAVDGLTDEQMAVMRRSLDESFNQISRDMLGTYRRLEGADPQYIQVELAKLKKANIARQILSPDKADQFEAIMQTLLEEQTANGVKYADLMTTALTNPPELVQQFGNINIEAVAAIAKDGRKRLQNHSEDAATKIIDAVANNLLQGGSMTKLTSTLSGQLGLVKHRAENIARTSTMTAFNQASKKRYEGYGVKYVQIIALVDRRTTPWCRWRHMRIVEITSSMPPFHFQCLVGDTNVSSCGKITTISARPYRGKVVRITTAAGSSLTVTPNHPVMTNQGFVAAKLLNCGDQVVRHLSGQRFSPTETDKDHMVSSIEEAFQSFLRSGEMLPVPMPLTAMNFHGDVTDNNIGVVLVNRHLSDGEIARIAQQFVHCYLKLATSNVSSPELRSSDFSEFVTGLFNTPSSLVSSFNEGKLAFCRKIVHSGLLLLRSIADMNSTASENPLDDAASNPEVFGDRLIPFAPLVGGGDLGDLPLGESMDLDVPAWLPSLGEYSGNGIGADPHLASDFLQTEPFISELDRIVNVEVLDFCGHVYNPSTETGVYVSNSIVSHNCRTTTAPVDPAWLSDDDLKWMQDEMAAAKKTGLVNMNRAPFDEKKPKFYTPSKFKNNIAPFKPKKQAIAKPADKPVEKEVAISKNQNRNYQDVLRDEERNIRDLPFETGIAINKKTGEVLFRKKGEKSEVELSPTQLVAMVKDTVFTHNHPSWMEKKESQKLGNSFSDDDLRLQMTWTVEEMRAVTPSQSFSMKFNNFEDEFENNRISRNPQTRRGDAQRAYTSAKKDVKRQVDKAVKEMRRTGSMPEDINTEINSVYNWAIAAKYAEKLRRKKIDVVFTTEESSENREARERLAKKYGIQINKVTVNGQKA